ncbi:MAG: amino acid adenylation domain-containing protein, partial [Gemmatimonadetes bacterium]|nr:amino acid adenylation domain-containing protein [Gemmatimonadota bacterium]
VPVGVAGELYLGGIGLARGYTGRPDLTAERFLPDARGTHAGARMYRTGDLARYFADGTIELLGRIDHQVKIRGFRIELEEINTALRRHPAVVRAVTVAREDVPGERRLVAYLVAAGGVEVPAPVELRELLRESLPDYMVPAAYVWMEALPLSANGKVDRKALPRPSGTHSVSDAAFPRTPTEAALAGIWSEVLGVEGIGIHDDFFEMGGHSLTATRALARVREAFGVEVPQRVFFDASSVAEVAAWVDAASGAGAGESELVPLRRLERDGPAPLSFAQQRLWVIDRMEPGSSAYNIPIALRLEGPLDAGLLECSLAELVERHESLRTVFTVVDGGPAQLVLPSVPVRLETVDLSGGGPDARLAAEADRPFDLERGPLFRGTLFRASPDEHLLLLVMHHVIGDGWSTGILLGELAAVYRARVAGEAPSLPELPVRYTDYAVWQRQWMRGPALESQVAWWRERLAGAAPTLELPTDRPRPPAASHRGGAVPFAVTGGLLERLHALGRGEDATLHMTLLAAFDLLLGRYAGTDDVVVGGPVAGRTRPELEGLVGFFVNTVVFRVDLSGDPTVRELLARVREATLGAYDHQDVPFDRLVEELRPERSLSHNPIFQAALALNNAGTQTEGMGALRTRRVEVPLESAKFDLALELEESPDGFEGVLRYAAELFDAATAERMAEHLAGILEAFAAGPDRHLSELSLPTPEERRLLLEGWNDTARPYPDVLVHERIAERARLAPDAAALADAEETLTYAELDRRANRLANHLRRLGVGPETRVGICLERSAGMVVAVLATLKAGGAYVPLDPAYPAERLVYTVEDSAAPVILTDSRHAEALAAPGAVRVCLDVERERISAESEHAPASGVGPENAAYLIYTSGSTGTPKGVAVEHRSLANFLGAAPERFGLEAGDVVPVLASYAFDIWLFETLLPLSVGATVRVLAREQVMEAARLVEALEDATTLHAVPALMRQVVEAVRDGGAGTLPRMRRVFVGGDAVPADLPAEMLAVFPGAEVHVMYGPTEGTILCTSRAVEPGERIEGNPIGRPLGNMRVYVVDAAGQPAPVGVPGELCIGGVAVTRGYLGRPELTAERFVPDPFGGHGTAGARLYCTGDRARWRPDGELEFLGRVDNQVKIRGFRIEPGEVEAVLAQHPAVRAATVTVREDVPRERRLVAYVVPADVEVAAAELRAWLKARLPEYMVPSAFVLLEALPLTPTGKVDRKALPAPEGRATGTYVAPRTPTEETLAEIWADVLRLDRVGAEDDFFALGGHSLLGTRVTTRMRDAFGVELPLRVVFEHPTLARLADRVEEELRAGAGVRIPPIVPAAREGRIPLSFEQQRLWFIDQLAPGNATYNIAAALRLHGPLDVRALARALGEIVRRHEALRTSFASVAGEPVQVIRRQASLPLPRVDLSALDPDLRERELRRLARAEPERPFDLAHGPLVRSTLVRLDREEHALLFTMHHIVGDGWSMQVLVNEATELYRAFARGRPSPLPEPELQYADYALWQRGWMRGQALDTLLGYWCERLAGAPPVLGFPTDRPRPAVASDRGATLNFDLPTPTLRALRALCHQEGATLFMTLLAAFQALLARWSGEADVVVGTPAARRTQVELEGLIGFFVNTLALRTDLSGNPTFHELLGRVRETTLGAYTHQDLPFDRLVEELGTERSLSHNPVFQVMFSLQLDSPHELSLGEVRGEPMPQPGSRAMFDLSLGVVEEGERLRGILTYRTDLFDRDTMERLAERFTGVLAEVAAHPGRTLATLESLHGLRGRLRRGGTARLARAQALDGLQAHLRASLPEYMVPSAFVFLEALPLTSSGKVDRRALPEPAEAAAAGEYVAPRTPAEAALAEVWADVLGVARVGVNDDFFALGGHSLLATRVVSRVREALGVEVPLRVLFEAPTVAGIAARLEELQQSEHEAGPPLRRVPRDGSPFPLSFGQQRLWFIDQFQPGSPLYNMPFALRVRGVLDEAALERSLDELVRRHETLRTVFPASGDDPVQVILPAGPVALPRVDLRGLAADARDAELLRRAGEEALRPFDLARGPLLRVTLLRLGEDDHALLFNMHHVVADGWSVGILVREVSALYGAFSRGEPSPLPGLPVQYADFAVWQREHVSEEVVERQLGYWRKQLAWAPPLLELPTDRPRPPVPGEIGASRPFALSAETTAALRELSLREGATLFMTLMTGFQALLARYSGQDDIVVGSPVAGRTRSEVEELIGFFVNTLVLRVDLSGHPTVREAIGRVREATLGAQMHQDLPFERLVEELAPERSLQHTPFFQVAFTFQNTARGELRMGGLRVESLETRSEPAKFDLTLMLSEEEDRVAGGLSYRAELFDASTIDRMAEHLGALLRGMAEHPDLPLSGVEIIAPAERQRMLEEWSAAEPHYPRELCVHELFAEQARRTPDAVAVVFAGEALTYAELDRRANRLANHLVRLGVGPDVKVGLCLERSLELVVGILGVLKAGGAYLPLDPVYPPERVGFMLGDSGAALVLIQEALRDHLPEGTATLALDTGWDAVAAESDRTPRVEVTPEHLCYVIYTSGSTGLPKGSEVPHRAIPGFFWDVGYARFDAEQTLLQHSSTSWDALTLELWPALLRGGRCVLYAGQSADVDGLERVVRDEGVTTVWLSAAFFNLVVDTRPELLATLAQVMTGGEAVSAVHVRRALELYPGLRIVNGYGPSECTVFTSCQVVTPEVAAGASVPIGRPVGDRRVYLLDRGFHPVPVGVPGELCVGGPAVARGYLGRPDLTAEKFVPDPFGEPGARLYRTGDLAHWTGEGVLEFVGRIDGQVKVRGFRIELEEIEAVLLEHPQVRASVATVREDGAGEKRVVAYVVPEEGGAPAAAELREYLKTRFPEYMVPGAFVALDALPLTANRKVDRRALPAPESFEAGRAYAAPRTPTEEVLAGIWAEVLGVKRVGVDENFFDLGGHSLLATRVVSRVREAFRMELPLRDLFEAPTVAGLTARVDAALRGDE